MDDLLVLNDGFIDSFDFGGGEEAPPAGERLRECEWERERERERTLDGLRECLGDRDWERPRDREREREREREELSERERLLDLKKEKVTINGLLSDFSSPPC